MFATGRKYQPQSARQGWMTVAPKLYYYNHIVLSFLSNNVKEDVAAVYRPHNVGYAIGCFIGPYACFVTAYVFVYQCIYVFDCWEFCL